MTWVTLPAGMLRAANKVAVPLRLSACERTQPPRLHRQAWLGATECSDLMMKPRAQSNGIFRIDHTTS